MNIIPANHNLQEGMIQFWKIHNLRTAIESITKVNNLEKEALLVKNEATRLLKEIDVFYEDIFYERNCQIDIINIQNADVSIEDGKEVVLYKEGNIQFTQNAEKRLLALQDFNKELYIRIKLDTKKFPILYEQFKESIYAIFFN